MAADMSDLARLADDEAISRVVQEYSRAADRCDQPALAAVYHSDGVDEHGSHFAGLGSDFAGWVATQRDVFVAGVHHVTTTYIDVVGDIAAVESETFGLVRLDTGKVSWSSGRYLDRLERRGGSWRLAYRRFVRDIPLPVPAHAQPRPDRGTTSTTSRSPADPSYALFAAARDGSVWPPANGAGDDG
jgi:ketosteroid isomerase-like protein